ncbi:MAG: tRNA (cytidine(34)-2'-O)-methyltransferase, partial [Halioglobus sp.]|nr:tRNA (cytidine(34)-2'-O)-methyltransferase [Halioglobus sp.]
MLRIVLYQPEIPPNTGNIIRLCANTGCSLHLVGPLGFELDDRRMRRAGLDYREYAEVQLYPDLDTFLQHNQHPRLYAATTRATRAYHQLDFQAGDAILFGPETRGLPVELLDAMDEASAFRIP